MKKIYALQSFFLIAFIIMQLSTNAQNVAINTDGSDPDPSAMLDIQSADKGLLIPRVALDDAFTAAPVTAPTYGLLIFNESGTEPHGYYFWDGSKWEKLATGPSSPWDENAGDIVYNGGNVGIGNSAPKYALDVNGDIRATGSVLYGGTSGSYDGMSYDKPDFVFQNGYKVMSVFDVEAFITKNKHLPWLTSAKEEDEGLIDITRMAFQTLEAVENMQLQIIELKKENEILKQKILELEKGK